MNSLPVKILTAILTFAIGVGIASVWLSRWWFNPGIEPVALTTPAARLEMVFVLDTTGSMAGLLAGAKERIWGIVNEVMQESHASVRIGLVAYRDRGDQYLTQVLPLTEDLDTVYTSLMEYKPAGGGDGPEDVRTALADGLNRAGWSQASPNLAQVIFLVGDAPPHNDYDDVADTLVTAAKAVQKGIVVNTIQCGTSSDTERAWQAIAQSGNGQYFAIAENGGVQTIATPYDSELSDLAGRLGSTVIAFGFGDSPAAEAQRSAIATRITDIEEKVSREAPATAKAERALNKVVSKEAYVGDLLQSIENGLVKIETINPADLPGYLQTLDPVQRQQEIEKRLAERREIKSRILSLSKQRDAYIDVEKKKTGDGKAGFDSVVAKTLREQMARKQIK
ncbi:MAG TPA: vWA domain-containing protein [Pyrinomonadaceae bacterium]|nr:vWA domain-containing protein [Pyrinomonadaceae bacterium]